MLYMRRSPSRTQCYSCPQNSQPMFATTVRSLEHFCHTNYHKLIRLTISPETHCASQSSSHWAIFVKMGRKRLKDRRKVLYTYYFTTSKIIPLSWSRSCSTSTPQCSMTNNVAVIEHVAHQEQTFGQPRLPATNCVRQSVSTSYQLLLACR